LAEPGTIDDARMGYQDCTVSGCGCLAYTDSYDGSSLCSNCQHDYSLHN
jgi:hypothetical protein